MTGITRERLAEIESGLVNHQLPPTPEMQDMAAALRRVWDLVEDARKTNVPIIEDLGDDFAKALEGRE